MLEESENVEAQVAPLIWPFLIGIGVGTTIGVGVGANVGAPTITPTPPPTYGVNMLFVTPTSSVNLVKIKVNNV